MYRLAKDLGRTIDELMEMSDAEFRGWAEFYKWEADEHKKLMNRSR